MHGSPPRAIRAGQTHRRQQCPHMLLLLGTEAPTQTHCIIPYNHTVNPHRGSRNNHTNTLQTPIPLMLLQTIRMATETTTQTRCKTPYNARCRRGYAWFALPPRPRPLPHNPVPRNNSHTPVRFAIQYHCLQCMRVQNICMNHQQ